MKRKPPDLSRPYLAALRTFLQMPPEEHPASAREVGRKAEAGGLEVTDLVRIHGEAVVGLLSLRSPVDLTHEDLIAQANQFFMEAIVPFEETHRGDKESNLLLIQRTEELADANEQLRREILQRLEVETSLRNSEETTSRLLEESRRLEIELRHLSRQLLMSQEEERKRLSRELHDVIAQTLSGVNLRLSAIRSQNSASTAELNKRIADTQRLVEESEAMVHRFSRELRPAVLDDLGLIPAVKSYLEGFLERTRLHGDLAADPEVEGLGPDGRTALFRVTQEALSNAARHAKASRVDVSLRLLDGTVVLEIHDDGAGFDVGGLIPDRIGTRLGLLGMNERVEMVGGTFSVESSPGAGATVRAIVPLIRRKPKSKQAKNRKLES